MSWKPWTEIYTHEAPPTADDVGAISTSGGTATGAIVVDGGVTQIGHAANGIHYFEGGILQWNAYYDENDGSYNVIQYDAVTGGYVAQRFRIDVAGVVAMNDPVSMSGQGMLANSLVRLDHMNASITGHYYPAAQGNSDIVAGGYEQVGTYALLHSDAGPTSIGSTHAGSTLHPADAEGNSSGGVSGTWKQLGHRSVLASDNTGSETTLFIRIA